MLPDDLLQLMRIQRGLAARYQVCDLEPHEGSRRSIYQHPELVLASPRVLRHRAVPWSIEQDVMIGVLDAGPQAVLWGKAGACHWGFGRFRRLPPHVVTPRRTLARDHVAQVHRVRHLADIDRTSHDDIPVGRPERIVLWLAAMWTHRFGHHIAADRTEVVIDHAWRQNLISGPFIHDLAARSGGSGRSGIVVLRKVLENRPPDYKPAGSRLEERFEEIVPWVVASKLERQCTVDAEEVIRTVDFRYLPWPLVIEVNGEAFHTSLTDRAADNERYERLLALGYSVVVFWEWDIWHDASTVRDAMMRIARRPDPIPTLHRPTKAPWEF